MLDTLRNRRLDGRPLDRGRSSVGRAPRSQCGGQGFNSPRLHQRFINCTSERRSEIYHRPLAAFAGLRRARFSPAPQDLQVKVTTSTRVVSSGSICIVFILRPHSAQCGDWSRNRKFAIMTLSECNAEPIGSYSPGIILVPPHSRIVQIEIRVGSESRKRERYERKFRDTLAPESGRRQSSLEIPDVKTRTGGSRWGLKPAASRRMIAGYAPPDAGVPSHLQSGGQTARGAVPRNLGCNDSLSTK